MGEGRGGNAVVMSVCSQINKPVWQAIFFFFFGNSDKDVTVTDVWGDKSRLSKRSREGSVTVGARGGAVWIMAKTDGAGFHRSKLHRGDARGIFIAAVSGIDGEALQQKPRLRVEAARPRRAVQAPGSPPCFFRCCC